MKNRFLTCALACLVAAGASAQNPAQPSWLSDAVFYQIYPSSFQDTDGNGIGDPSLVLAVKDGKPVDLYEEPEPPSIGYVPLKK